MPAFPSKIADTGFRLTLTLCALLASAGVRAEGDCSLLPSEVHVVLDQFLSAKHSYSYSGTLLLEQNNQRKFLTASSAPGSEVTLRQMNSPTPAARERFPLPGSSPGLDACDIGVSYRVAVEIGAAVAGRPTQRLTIRPRDRLRFGYIMDIDTGTGLPLRVVTATPDGQMIERYEFATIEVTDILTPASEVSGTDATSVADAPPLPLTRLPDGFKVANSRPGQIVVTDGLATASLFVSALPTDLAPGEGTVRQGSTLTYTRGFAQAGSQYLVTVIGEVPVNTARLLAMAVEPTVGG